MPVSIVSRDSVTCGFWCLEILHAHWLSGFFNMCFSAVSGYPAFSLESCMLIGSGAMWLLLCLEIPHFDWLGFFPQG